jgi:hypothetical protein
MRTQTLVTSGKFFLKTCRLGFNFVRKHYNSVTKTVWIRTMPTTIHDCHQRWFEQSEKAWYIAGQLTQAEFVNITHYAGTSK